MLCLMLAIVSATIAADDAYIAGYAAAVLRHEFNAAKASWLVQNGVVTVEAESLDTVDRTKVQTALESIPGVVRVEVREGPAAIEARVKISSSRPFVRSVPCRSAVAAFFRCVPSYPGRE